MHIGLGNASSIRTGLIASLLIAFLINSTFPATGQNMSSNQSSLSVEMQANNIEKSCAPSATQHVILGDLHLVEALRSMLDNDSSAAMEQLELAKKQLSKGQQIRSC
jgi:hypothetical protein